jgi:integrase-like protein
VQLTAFENGYVERLIGSIRRECADHLLAFNAGHLRRILSKYASYYNGVRTHVSRGKDAPCRRPIERFGDIMRIRSLADYTIITREFEFSEATGGPMAGTFGSGVRRR